MTIDDKCPEQHNIQVFIRSNAERVYGMNIIEPQYRIYQIESGAMLKMLWCKFFCEQTCPQYNSGDQGD